MIQPIKVRSKNDPVNENEISSIDLVNENKIENFQLIKTRSEDYSIKARL